MYYQFDRYGRYLTLTQEDCKAITEWINEYFVGGSAPFPLSGAIPAADYKFVIDYYTEAASYRVRLPGLRGYQHTQLPQVVRHRDIQGERLRYCPGAEAATTQLRRRDTALYRH